MTIETVILAAGQGTRMRSKLPKVLQPIAGKAMVEYVIDTANTISHCVYLVVGHQAEAVKLHLNHRSVSFVLQEQQLGTGHALAQALPELKEESVALVLYGDVPFVQPETVQQLTTLATQKDTLCLLTTYPDDPTGYGRIIRNDQQQVIAIVEHKDATTDQLQIREVNSGILAVPVKHLKTWLPALSNQNSQQEYYLTDIVAMAVAANLEIATVHPQYLEETLGINDRLQQATLERWYQKQQTKQLMSAGVSCADPDRVDIRGQVIAGQDVFIDVNNVFEGNVSMGDGVRIGPNCYIRNAIIGDNVDIRANSVIEDAEIGADSMIGPFARIRPDTRLAPGVHIGNFVEIKKSNVSSGSKINHLTYIGDADIGSGVNIGAGTITCNYDGVNKFRTTIADGVFVGSNSTLVAPVQLNNESFIAAGSVITQATEAGKLTIARSRQQTIDNWKRPTKNRGEDK
ncbi:bifunctional UDP-N-acetylglucosamine diphosphorylase/glucosamine-1-phosphate N-acetyltransferase GlmU [Gynuella sp.]|uniref:bifunctional UDP-N-acetylglucosamine diphosphorylase/glucosamine-1-phosphate N-acetyltransferase GlmU n=1 Tax=Gynuella sp. TaxID=2969146 RepID=UPI003D1388DF